MGIVHSTLRQDLTEGKPQRLRTRLESGVILRDSFSSNVPSATVKLDIAKSTLLEPGRSRKGLASRTLAFTASLERFGMWQADPV